MTSDKASRTIVLVEDEPALRDNYRLALEKAGYSVQDFATAAAAISAVQVKSRQQLMDAANVVLDDQTITAHVKRIRKKFLTIDNESNCIQTVYSLGYRWVEGFDY